MKSSALVSAGLEVAGEEVSGCGSSVGGCLSQGGKLGQAWAHLRTWVRGCASCPSPGWFALALATLELDPLPSGYGFLARSAGLSHSHLTGVFHPEPGAAAQELLAVFQELRRVGRSQFPPVPVPLPTLLSTG